jgi:cell division septation protein DedD
MAMERKIFVQKGMKKGGGKSYLKLLMWSALALFILVLLIPLGTRKKSETNSVPKATPEKGVVVREIPKASVPSGEGEKKTDGIPGFVPFDKSPEAGVTPEVKALPEPQQPGKLPPGAEKAVVAPSGGVKPETFAETPPKSTAEKPGGPAATMPPSAKEGKTAAVKEGLPGEDKPAGAVEKTDAKPASPADVKKKTEPAKTAAVKSLKPPAPAADTSGKPATTVEEQKPSATGGRTMFAVQVGSFKEKGNAEEMQRNLQKKGYSVQVRSRVDPKLGQLFVVQLAPVDTESKASTLVEQIRREDKVKPFVVKVPGSE